MENVGITKKTVLVLGAGASKPFGFPLGRELIRDICQESEPFGDKSLLKQTVVYPNDRESGLERARVQYNNFVNKYKLFKRALEESGQPSVDAFLEKQPKLAKTGKLAIAGVLLNSEKTNGMFKNMLGDNNWYQSLFEKLDEGGSLESFGQNKLAIVTFNYDRSLEQYLFTALINSYEGVKEEECAKAVERIPIIHVYGSLGRLPWQDKDNNTPYDLGKSHPIRPEQIEKASETINIIRNDNDLKEFDKAWAKMEDAKRIYFLGFGFDRTNVNRLNFESLSPNKEIGGTCMGVSRETRKIMEGLCTEEFPLARRSINERAWKGVDVYDFLHDHITLD